MKTFADKKAILTNHGIEEINLDAIVHDVLSETASSINNDGIDAQLSFLFQRGLTVKQIQERL